MFSKIILTIAVFGLAQAARRQVLENPEDNTNPNYSYGYDVQDTVTGDSKNHLENRNGNVVRGQYSLNDPDGTRRTVQYTADPINGFVAVVKKEAIVQQQPLVQQQPQVQQQQLIQQQPLVQSQILTVPQQQAVVQQQQLQEPASIFQQFQQFQQLQQLQQLQQFQQLQQPISLVQERIYVAQPFVQQSAYVAQQPAQQQTARLVQKPKSQRQTAPEVEETTTVNSDSEDIEPTTAEPVTESNGYYYPPPASPAALFAKKEPLTVRKAPKAQPAFKSEKLEMFPEEPLSERVNPVAAPNPAVGIEPVRVNAQVFNPYVQAPLVGFSAPYTFSTVTVL